MSSDQVTGDWETIKDEVRTQWQKLPPEHLDRLNGDRVRLAGLIRENYGVTDAEARHQVDTFFSNRRACRI